MVLESDKIVDCDELVVFNAAVHWLAHNHAATDSATPVSPSPSSSSSTVNAAVVCAKQDVISDVMCLVRFPQMTSCVLSDVVKPNRFMVRMDQLNLLLEAFEYHALK